MIGRHPRVDITYAHQLVQNLRVLVRDHAESRARDGQMVRRLDEMAQLSFGVPRGIVRFELKLILDKFETRTTSSLEDTDCLKVSMVFPVGDLLFVASKRKAFLFGLTMPHSRATLNAVKMLSPVTIIVRICALDLRFFKTEFSNLTGSTG